MALLRKEVEILAELEGSSVLYLTKEEDNSGDTTAVTIHFDSGHKVRLSDIGEQGWGVKGLEHRLTEMDA